MSEMIGLKSAGKPCTLIGWQLRLLAISSSRSPAKSASQHCVMEGSARLECGYPAITAEECQGKGCCFNSYDINTRWCFHPLSDTGKYPTMGATFI
uniref:P-type domain-containing protein n=1 Tax=Naja naja TaxID=35670 RepID=A0A8C6XX25_NAJNA